MGLLLTQAAGGVDGGRLMISDLHLLRISFMSFRFGSMVWGLGPSIELGAFGSHGTCHVKADLYNEGGSLNSRFFQVWLKGFWLQEVFGKSSGLNSLPSSGAYDEPPA